MIKLKVESEDETENEDRISMISLFSLPNGSSVC